jgi:hypothetical protein
LSTSVRIDWCPASRTRRMIGGLPRLDGVLVTRCDVVHVGAGLARRAQPLRLPLAIEPAAEQVALDRVLGRRDVVEPAALGIDALHLEHVVVALGDQPHLLPVAGDDVDVVPPVAVAHPGEALAVVQPDDVVHHVHPGAVLLQQDRPHLPRLRVAQHHLVAILQPVQPLEDDLGRRGRPIHPGDVVVPRITRDLQPAHGPAGGAHDADARGGVGLAHLRILNRDDLGVERVGVVDQMEVLHRVCIELPEGDPAPVRAPAPAVGVVVHQLLFVHPVEGAVDERAGAVGGERGDGAAGEVLHVQVVLPHVGDAPAVG